MNSSINNYKLNQEIMHTETREKMSAAIRDVYGPPEAAMLQETERPTPQDDEALIRARGSSINFGDWVLMTGKPRAARLMFGVLRPRQKILGMDVAGCVEAVGKNVTRFRPGDEVFGETLGAYAEYVCAREEQLALKPSNLTFEQAATIPVAGTTALQGLRDKANVGIGDKVLINGASGGVGTYAVQIAKHLGAEVTGVCSTRNLDLVKSIGADHVVDYTQSDFTRTSERYDAIFDLVGSASLRACRRILSPKGVYIASVGSIGWTLKSFFASLLPGWRIKVLAAQTTAEDLSTLKGFIEAGVVTPVIDQQYTLGEVSRALRYQAEGHTRGKSTLTI